MRVLVFLRLLGFCLLVQAAGAQDDASFDAAAILSEAQERLKALGDPKTDDEKTWKGTVEQRVSLAKEWIETAKVQAEMVSEAEIASRKQKVDAALERQRKIVAPKTIELDSAEELDGYEKTFNAAQAERNATQAELDRYKKRRDDLKERTQGLPERESTANKRLGQLTGKDDLSRYRADNERLTLRIVAQQRAFFKQAIPRVQMLIPVLELERDLAKLRYTVADETFGLARAEASKLREAEAESATRKAEAEKQAAERARDPLERFRRSAAAEASEARANTKGLQNTLSALKQANTERASATSQLAKERTRLETRLKVRGTGSAELLRRSLDRSRRSRRLMTDVHLPEIQAETAKYEAQLVEVLDRLWELQLPKAENEVLKGLVASVPPSRADEAERVFGESTQRNEGLIVALRDERRLLESIDGELGSLTTKTQAYVGELDALIDFVLHRIYWIRSDAPLRLQPSKSMDELAQAWRIATDGKMWAEVGTARTVTIGLFLGAVVFAFFFAGMIRRRRRHKESGGGTPRPPRWGRAIIGLLATCLPPVALAAIALFIDLSKLPRTVADPLETVFYFIAFYVAIRRVAVWFLAADGVAVRLLGWESKVSTYVLRSIRIVATAGILFEMPGQVLLNDPFALSRIPRISYTLWICAVALAIGLLFWRRSPLVESLTQPGGVMRKGWKILAPLLWASLVAIIAMDVMGYRVGSEYLLLNLGRTLGGLLALAGLYALLVRAIGGLATRVRRKTMAEEGVAAAYESSAAVTHQLTSLVAFLLTATAFGVLFMSWGFGPLLSDALDQVHLIDIDPGKDQYLTAWNVVCAALWIIGGHFIVHNLAAVYEFIVFPLIGGTDRGARYVLLTLSRYAILLVTYMAALVTLKLSFASIGWLLTAASVGIGFGLQEIIANFISGLILLIERPVRVGDIITVGQSGGTVDRINIRATAVINWDRQTIMIPNKNLITQNLTNWTRNDQIMRRTLHVGVAFGSDVEKVLRVLDDLVKSHPNVLKDPSPTVLFEGFGESCLKFKIWLFTRIPDGFSTMTALYTQITTRLADEGIEIPVPRRDIRIRPVDGDQSLAATLEKPEADDQASPS